jgi:hypothetical protein
MEMILARKDLRSVRAGNGWCPPFVVRLGLACFFALSSPCPAQPLSGLASVPPTIAPNPVSPLKRGPGPNGERRLIVKFVDNAGFSASAKAIFPPPGRSTTALNQVLGGISGITIHPLITGVAQATLTAMVDVAAARSGRTLADMTQYFAIELPAQVADREVKTALSALLSTPGVDFAYEAPAPAPPPVVDIAPTTPLLIGEQFYLKAAALGGFGVEFAWTQAGGKGDPVGAVPPVRLVDIEYNWNEHEDLSLSAVVPIGGERYAAFGSNHGTAVVGIAAGIDNSYGIVGIAPLSDTRAHATLSGGFWNLPDAITRATALTKAGDVLLVEQQYGSDTIPRPPCPAGCACDSARYLPVEIDRAMFDAISAATAAGRVVVLTAGNGFNNLDWYIPANYTAPGFPLGNPFDRAIYNSGAIYVGAGYSVNFGQAQRTPHCYSNFGSRLDLQGMGDGVVTLGYGDRFDGDTGSGADSSQLYTAVFAGTSSSGALLAGVTTIVQSYTQTKGFTANAGQVLKALKEGALAQQGSRLIGPLPDLAKALPSIRPDTLGVYRATNQTFYLRNFNSAGLANFALTLGIAGDKPLVGDWNGDKVSTIGLWRPSTQEFFFKNSNRNTAPVIGGVKFGLAGDIPLVGDWDGNGSDTIGVWRPSTRQFLLRNSNSTGSPNRTVTFGTAGDIPIVGDWDGDGTDTPGVMRPNTGRFLLSNTTCVNCLASVTNTVGPVLPTDLPVVGDWNWDGRDGVGVFRQSSVTMYLWDTLAVTKVSRSFRYGSVGDSPIAGAWK